MNDQTNSSLYCPNECKVRPPISAERPQPLSNQSEPIVTLRLALRSKSAKLPLSSPHSFLVNAQTLLDSWMYAEPLFAFLKLLSVRVLFLQLFLSNVSVRKGCFLPEVTPKVSRRK